jgi:EAL domain-containing protein (putative c-di-GMP-specific phosphodiesterase class I)
VCAQARIWQRSGAPLRAAVNVSARQFMAQSSVLQPEKNLVEQVRLALKETGLPPELLELEIIESVSVRQDGLKILNELSGLGVRVSLDDFGLGSALDCLKRLPLDALKIDQTFVSSLPGDARDAAIVQAIIAMGHGLGLTVIAEGVETKEQLDFLRAENCDEAQGYLFASPLPPDQLTELLYN